MIPLFFTCDICKNKTKQNKTKQTTKQNKTKQNKQQNKTKQTTKQNKTNLQTYKKQLQQLTLAFCYFFSTTFVATNQQLKGERGF